MAAEDGSDDIRVRIGDLSRPFAIDRVIRERVGASRPPRILTVFTGDQATGLARLALDKAITAAEVAAFTAPPSATEFSLWADLAARADKVVEAMDELFRGLDPQARSGAMAQVIGQVRSSSVQGVAENMRGSREIAEDLRRGRGRADELGRSIRSHVETFPPRQNPGDPVGAAFVGRLADAWVILTGAPPGAANLPEKNPFLRFALAGWSDWKGDEAAQPSFIGALAASRVRLSPFVVGEIRRVGPSWLER